MNKNIKRSLSLLMVFAIVLSTVFTGQLAYAEGASITLKNTEAGKEYRLYKILDLTYSGGKDSQKNVSYTIAEDWKEFFKNDGSKYLVNSNDEGKLNQVYFNEKNSFLNITEANVNEFAMDAFEYAAEKKATKTVTSEKAGDLKVDVSDLGYYLVYPKGASINLDGQPSIVSLTSTLPDAEVNLKSTYPTISKTVAKEFYDLGEEIDYTLKTKLPDTRGFKNYTFKISDKLGEGLTLIEDSVEIKVAGKVLDDGYTIEAESNSLVIDFNEIGKAGKAGEEIEVSYKAFLNENAVIGQNGNHNDVTLEYGNDPKAETTDTSKDTTVVYTGLIKVLKIDGNDEELKLKGAEFALKNTEGKYYKLTEDNKIQWVDTIEEATILVTGEDGRIEFNGLKAGKYKLVETKAPEGYNKLNKDIDIDLTEELLRAEKGEVETIVENKTGLQLPGTGGAGTKAFTLVGGMVIILAAYNLVRNKSKKEERY